MAPRCRVSSAALINITEKEKSATKGILDAALYNRHLFGAQTRKNHLEPRRQDAQIVDRARIAVQ